MVAADAAGKDKKSKASRFLGPAQLDEAKRSQLQRALRRRKIGDETGRQIFVAALEYQLSAFGEGLQPSSAEEEKRPANPQRIEADSATEATLRSIVGTAASLASLLRALPDDVKLRLPQVIDAEETAPEPEHGEHYLEKLSLQLDRLGRACIVVASTPQADTAPPPQSKAESKARQAANRNFVAKLASIFFDCFEKAPTAHEDGAFRGALQTLVEVTGLPIAHDPEFLKQVLAAEFPERAGD